VVSVAQLDANRVTVDFTDDVTAGQEWQLSAQPSWLVGGGAGRGAVSGFGIRRGIVGRRSTKDQAPKLKRISSTKFKISNGPAARRGPFEFSRIGI
jgi:hypothetical protein